MPKIIANLQETILTEAKALLLERGFRALNVRDVAKRCNIAVGTLYNYFASKEMLAASIMLADWSKTMDDAEAAVDRADSCIDGLEVIHNAVHSYSACYSRLFGEFGPAMIIPEEYHNKLVAQLTSLTERLFSRFHMSQEGDICHFLAENILYTASHSGSDFETVRPILHKLLF